MSRTIIALSVLLCAFFLLQLSAPVSADTKAVVSQTTPTCGHGRRGNGRCPDGYCCSRYGWCQTSLTRCGNNDLTPGAHPTVMMKKPVGFVYAGTNDPTNNEVVAYERDQNGLLKEMSRYAAGGAGFRGAINDPLGSQYSLIRSPDANHILYVNGGSDTIAVFRRLSDGSLNLTSVTSSQPAFNSSVPASLTANGNLVYVLNSGSLATPAGVSSISGFRANWTTGTLTYIAGSTRSFPGNFGQVAFTPDQKFLILPGKRADMFLTFSVNAAGVPAQNPIVTPVGKGRIPFSVAFDKSGNILVSEAFGGVASYSIDGQGKLNLIEEVNTGSLAACWIVRYRNSDVFYVVNAAKPSIGAFRLTPTGRFTQVPGRLHINATTVDDDTVIFPPGAVPLDATITLDGKFLYVILGGRGTVASYSINPVSGLLMSRGEFELLLPGFNGINGITSI